MSQDVPQNVLVSVRRIKEVSFSINESLYAQQLPVNPDIPLKIEIAFNLSFTIETNLVFLVARVFYHFPDSPPQDILTEIQVQNVFEINELSRFQVSGGEIKLPPNTIVTLVALSISHTRALLAKNISGTLLQENVMSIIDPVVLAQHFFPPMFAPNTPLEEIIDAAV
jgi:hypothetical protein